MRSENSLLAVGRGKANLRELWVKSRGRVQQSAEPHNGRAEFVTLVLVGEAGCANKIHVTPFHHQAATTVFEGKKSQATATGLADLRWLLLRDESCVSPTESCGPT